MGINLHIWVLLFVPLLVAVAALSYRNTTPPVSGRPRIVLILLRSAAFALIVFLLLDPRYVYELERSEPARVIALIDQSASMNLSARGPESPRTRFQAARELAADLRGMVESSDGEYGEAFFSGGLVVASADTLSANGQGTDITRSLTELHKKYEGENLVAFVLLSDGVETTRRLVRHSVPPVPVFAIGLGDTSSPEDVRIVDLDYNAIVRVPSRTSIAATLRYTGSGSKRVQLQLSENGNIVFRKDTLFTPRVREIEFETPIRFSEPGRRAFVMDAVVDGYDAENDNNRRDIVIDAEKGGVKIMIVDLLPAWELHFLTDFLRRDESFDFDLVSSLGERASLAEGRLESPGNFAEKLREYDALVIASINEQFMDDRVSRAIRAFVLEAGKGLLVLPGHSSLFEHSGAWGRISDLLPVRGTPPHRFNLQFTSVRPGAQAASNPITSQLIPLLSQTDWQQRSPLLGYYSPLVAKSGVEVLLETDGPRVPAFIYQSAGKGRVALLSVGPLWRWKFLSEGITMYDEMVSRLLDVLARGEDTARFVLTSKKNVYDSGETPSITAEIFDEKMQPVTGAAVSMEITRIGKDGSEVPLDIVSMQREAADNPRFKATLPPLPPGTYRLKGEAELAGRSISSQDIDISVSEVSVEYQRVEQDRSNLVRIAGQSGGAYWDASGLAELADNLPLEKRITMLTSELSLRTSAFIFGLIILLLSVEWIMRKRVGMV